MLRFEIGFIYKSASEMARIDIRRLLDFTGF